MESAARIRTEVGYDLSRFDRRLRVRDALADEMAERSEKREESVNAVVREKTSARISVFAVIGFLFIMGLQILSVWSGMTLHTVSAESAGLKTDLRKLRAEEATLKSQYERKLNLKDIEARAEALGMSRPQSGQIVYIDLSSPDHAIVYGREEDKVSDFFNGIKGSLGKIVEYIN